MRTANLLPALVLSLMVGACASPASTRPGATGSPAGTVANGSRGEAAGVDSAGAEGAKPGASAELNDYLNSLLADSLREPRREPSILPFGTLWTPRPAEEGSAIGIRVLVPAGGRQPVAVQGTFADTPVRFGPLNGAWFGIAAIPIGVFGDRELVLALRFEDGQEREQRITIPVQPREWSSTTLRVAPRFTSPSPEALDRIRREREAVRAVLDSASPEWLIEGEFRPPRPVDVTSPFGQQRLFNGELQSRHRGLDLRGADGDPVYAAGRGRVALAGDFYFSGNGVYLDHGHGVYTAYFHLSSILVEKGEIVERGQLIGAVGATGRVTGPHLHWSLFVAGAGVDAASLLELELPSD